MSGPVRSLFRLVPLAAALSAAPAPAVTVDWVAVGGPGNACDAQPQGCFGAVAAGFSIARTEVTNAQYAEFLNAVAQADPNGLYHTSMASSGAGHGGITRSGSDGAYSYAAVAGRETLPVTYVSFYDALRFANWLHNGQPTGAQGAGTTETGAYAITAQGIAGNSIARDPAATVALASENEWYKAAYYDVPTAAYFDYPTRTDTVSVCGPPAAAANTANCGAKGGIPGAGNLIAVESYTGAASPNGTFDQGGNVWEWNEAIVDGTSRGLRGGSFNHNVSNLKASTRSSTLPDAESNVMGFRVVSLPEPGIGAMLLAGGLALACLRRLRDRRIAAIALLALPAWSPAAADGDPSLIGGGDHGGSFTWDYCQGKPDATPLPADPRTLAQPGTNEGKAVYINTYWKNCHVNPTAVQEVGIAETCGELRARFDRGGVILDPGSEGSGGLFTGTSPGAGSSTLTADQYNQVWQVWGGYTARPTNFDELAAERYGSAFSSSPNPYPMPGEDPNQTNGGSGRLPELFTQLRNTDGSWSGEITVTCHGCHSGAVGGSGEYGGVGPGLAWGGGSSLADLNLFLRDFLALGYEASAAVVLNLNHTRGRNDASLINIAFAAAGPSMFPVLPGVVTSGTTADLDTPAWWNMGHRPAKFVDGVFPMDSPRVDAVFYAANVGSDQVFMRENGPDMNVWIEAQKSPAYPFAIDTALAEQGARLFHELDLWGPSRNNPIRPPTLPGTSERVGNGSCASCHGAYADRYVHDPAFLDSPELEGIAAYQVPLDIIGTDPQRLIANNESVQTAGRDSFFGYPQTKNTPQDCGPQNGEAVRPEGRELGYLAPPLYGIWATAPYLHNGSVPNLWEVLKPSARKRIWKRVSRPALYDPVSGALANAIMGYDTSLDQDPEYGLPAYDTQNVGWRYDEIACNPDPANPTITPYVACDPDPASTSDPLAQQILAVLYQNVLAAWNIFFPPPLTPAQMEDRKIFNTQEFAQGNEGHDFSAVLSDGERRAIIEYLKTL